MNTRDMISTYTTHGGTWCHLKKQLIQEGLSEDFTNDYISRCRYRLGRERAQQALQIYDRFVKNQCEKETKLFMVLIHF